MNEAKSIINDSASGLFEELKKERKKLISAKVILDKKDNHTYPIVELPFEIPSNWVWCYLSDISFIQEGPGIRKHQYVTSGIQFLTVTNILEGSVDLKKSEKYISKEQYKNYSHFTINKGDIVTACSGGSWGKSAIYELDEKIILNTSTLRLRFYNDLGDNYYLYYLTKTSYFKDSLSKYITGQQPNYGYSHYSKIPIPLPPLPEQQRIVAILDEAFAAIAKAKANAEQNLKNAKELFESYLQGVFENKGEGWEEKKLGDVCKILNGGTPDTTVSNFWCGDNLWITPKDMGKLNSIYVDDTLRKLTDEGLKNSSAKILPPNSIILSSRAPIGYLAINTKPISTNQGCKGLIPNGNLLPMYLYYFLSNSVDLLISLGTGTTFKELSGSKLESVEIPLPPLSDQQNIVLQFDALRAETQKLEAVYQQKLADLEELKKSILQKALAGELTDKSIAS